MAGKVVWSYRADRDLQALYDYIATENPPAAVRYVEGLRNACRRLEEYPQSGKAFDGTYRVVVYRNHLVFHRHDALRNVIVVVRVVDARRDLSAGIEQLGF
jgi:plasmid stabilization system protein ParE